MTTGDVARKTVMIVDDHPMWRDAVERDVSAAGLDVVACAQDGASAVRRAQAVQPDVMVLDLNLPDCSGDEVVVKLKEVSPHTAVLILSASAEPSDVLKAVRAGATGYLVKSASAEELLAGIQATAVGEPVFTPGLAGLILGDFRRAEKDNAADGLEQLTKREVEVLKLVAKGMSYKDIAERLVISHRTVQNHVQNTLTKLHLNNRVELARFAIANGLDEPGDSE